MPPTLAHGSPHPPACSPMLWLLLLALRAAGAGAANPGQLLAPPDVLFDEDGVAGSHVLSHHVAWGSGQPLPGPSQASSEDECAATCRHSPSCSWFEWCGSPQNQTVRLAAQCRPAGRRQGGGGRPLAPCLLPSSTLPSSYLAGGLRPWHTKAGLPRVPAIQCNLHASPGGRQGWARCATQRR